MTPKKFSIISLIAVSTVGLFSFFLNIFNQQTPSNSSGNTNVNNTVPNSTSSLTSQNTTQTNSNNSTTSTSTTQLAPTSSASTTTTSPTTSTPTAVSSTSVYKDGSYKANASYRVPRGSESIALSLTLKGDVVSDLTETNSAFGGESGQYQRSFSSEIKGQVVGKKIQDVDLSSVGGASLTTDAFVNALNTIKNSAKN